MPSVYGVSPIRGVERGLSTNRGRGYIRSYNNSEMCILLQLIIYLNYGGSTQDGYLDQCNCGSRVVQVVRPKTF